MWYVKPVQQPVSPLMDCAVQTWKRRHFRIIGANMVAFNDVTKRAITTIDLKKAVSLHDDQDRSIKTPASHVSSSSYDDEFDGPCGVEKSFKLLFPGNQRISFFADTEADKARWYVYSNVIPGKQILNSFPLGWKFSVLSLVVSPLILSGQSFSGRSNRKIWRSDPRRPVTYGLAHCILVCNPRPEIVTVVPSFVRSFPNVVHAFDMLALFPPHRMMYK